MWSSMPMAVVLSMAALLAIVSAIAGALAWRLRHAERLPSARTIQAWNERLDEIEALVRAGSSQIRSDRPRHPTGPRPTVRIEPPPEPPRTPRLIAVPDLSASASVESDPTQALRRRFQEIWDQADSGLDAGAIARASGQPIGQVELILGLRRFGSARS